MVLKNIHQCCASMLKQDFIVKVKESSYHAGIAICKLLHLVLQGICRWHIIHSIDLQKVSR